MKLDRYFLFTALALCLSGCGNTQLAYSSPPVPANATQVERGINPEGLELISFRTSDSPDVVLSHYQNVLTAAGWVLDRTFPAKEHGLTPHEVAASRPICPPCAEAIDEAGATPVIPLRQPRSE